jgi:hypothetical protein
MSDIYLRISHNSSSEQQVLKVFIPNSPSRQLHGIPLTENLFASKERKINSVYIFSLHFFNRRRLRLYYLSVMGLILQASKHENTRYYKCLRLNFHLRFYGISFKVMLLRVQKLPQWIVQDLFRTKCDLLSLD